ncbi:RING-H2 finger protein ATL80-like [Oryza brachyantha]|uniref:RING-type domain-containing protein n=1 Tax=Oryza brachyantha TaxID=4533 RepID=J3MZZ1_ORYBR|nr:RING-H2 finger protein ATL80-like [Oryza brachyantha]
MRHLLQSADNLAAATATATASGGGHGGVHTDTLLILAAVFCFLLCVVGLALVARCSRLCNPSSFAVEAEPDAGAEGAMPPAPASKGLKKKALQSLPTVSFGAGEEEEEERPECAICLAEFARGDEVRVLPPCGHGFHAACVDVWLLSSSTCPSCRRALVVVAPPSPATAEPPSPPCCAADAAQASSQQEPTTTSERGRGRCRTSVP